MERLWSRINRTLGPILFREWAKEMNLGWLQGFQLGRLCKQCFCYLIEKEKKSRRKEMKKEGWGGGFWKTSTLGHPGKDIYPVHSWNDLIGLFSITCNTNIRKTLSCDLNAHLYVFHIKYSSKISKFKLFMTNCSYTISKRKTSEKFICN